MEKTMQDVIKNMCTDYLNGLRIVPTLLAISQLKFTMKL